jgi:elongation factor P
MDNDNLEQVSLRCAGPDDRGLWLKEGEGYDLLFWRGRPLDLALPAQMVFVVAECWTSPRAETILGADKPATMETGLSLRVPLSVMPGDRILVDTATKSYHGRYDGA